MNRKKFSRLLSLTLCVAVIAAMILFASACNGNSASSASSSVSASSSAPSSSEAASSEESSSEGSSSETVSSEPEPEPEPEPIIPELEITNPSSADITVNSPSYVIRGSSDPTEPVMLGDTEIAVDENGYFAHTVTLSEGANHFKVSHKERTREFVIRYKKIIIKEISPSSAVSKDSKTEFVVSCTALKESTVTATWNKTTVTLHPADSDGSTAKGEYVTYVGSFDIPLNTGPAKNLGGVSFKVVSPSGTATKTSGSVTVKKFDQSKYDGGNGYPVGSDYLNVGTSLIAEITTRQGETFNASDATDLSRPTNNYLPAGTVDYCSPFTKNFRVSGKNVELVTLRYGKQIYKTSPRGNVHSKVYEGTLPETNKLTLSSAAIEDRHTVFTLDTEWKAPFKLEYSPQAYTSTGSANRDYTLKNGATFDRIVITFCYAEALDTTLLDLTENPLFSSFEIAQREHDTVLTLHLKKTGGFYGWSAEYNAEGQLQFFFLNPTVLTEAENEFGYSLEGVTVAIDAGHGGKDEGAVGFEKGKNEAQLNLYMAKELEAQLKALGANVLMIRSDDENVEVDDRNDVIRDAKPDFCISIHRNSINKAAISGLEVYHFNPHTAAAAHAIYNASMEEGIYKTTANSRVKWHVFFLSRVSDCPVVLTENGYISNTYDYQNMKDPEKNKALCTAMIRGMINYFLAQ